MATLGIAVIALPACNSVGGGKTLTIETDYAHDEFAGSMWGFFPNKVTVRPGMTLKFHQTWTGEAHTVTMGTRVAELVAPFRDVLDEYFDTGILGEEPEGVQAFMEGLPFFFGEQGVNQTAAQPCLARSADEIPSDESACANRTLQPFKGDEAYYNSGFIPFEGSRGNTFELPIAQDAKPGTYFYYCNLHGSPMGGEITVTDDGEASRQSALNRRAKVEADRMAKALLEVYRDEKAGKSKIKGNLAGSGDERTEHVFGVVNEFTPRTIETKVGEKVTWTMLGHNLSFNVPPYAPIFTIKNNGEVEFNSNLDEPSGGWPGRTPALSEAPNAPEPKPVHIDAGAFDGSGGFKSNGTGWANGDIYSVTFTKKGTYPYACIVHPGMIAKVVVN